MGLLIALGMSSLGLYLLDADRRGQELLHPKVGRVVGAVLLPIPLGEGVSAAVVALQVADREVQVLVVDRGLHDALVNQGPELEALGLPLEPGPELRVLELPADGRGQMIGFEGGAPLAVATFGPEGRLASAGLEGASERWPGIFDQALAFLREGGAVSVIGLDELPGAPSTLEGLVQAMLQAWAGSWSA